MKNIITILLICTLMSFTGCPQAQNREMSYASIEGKWVWVNTSGGMVGRPVTPAMTGNEVIIEFTVDHQYKKYVNGVMESAVECEFINGSSIFSESETLQLKYANNAIQQTIEINEDELILREECTDCYQHVYKRQ